jgi:hypothetical protein
VPALVAIPAMPAAAPPLAVLPLEPPVLLPELPLLAVAGLLVPDEHAESKATKSAVRSIPTLHYMRGLARARSDPVNGCSPGVSPQSAQTGDLT